MTSKCTLYHLTKFHNWIWIRSEILVYFKNLNFLTLQLRLGAKCICRPIAKHEYHILQHRSSPLSLVYFLIGTILNFLPVLYSFIVACLIFSHIKIETFCSYSGITYYFRIYVVNDTLVFTSIGIT